MNLSTTPVNIASSPTNGTISEFRNPFDDVTVIVVAVILIFFAVFGIVGNLLTICVIITSSRLNNIFNQFILSLCASDLFSSLISWTNLYRRTWGFNIFTPPNFFCWFYWGAEMWTSYVTALHILSFGILRLLSVWKPIGFSKIKKLHGRIWIATIWGIGFLCGFIPFALFSGAKVRDRSDRSSATARWPSCTQNQETLKQYEEYIKYAYSIFFYVPLVGIVFVSIFIAIVLVRKRLSSQKLRSNTDQKRQSKEKQKEKQAILQLALIVGSFMMGYIPFTIFEFWTVANTDKSYSGWKVEWMFGTIQYMFMRLSECLNPVFYNLASSKMRSETHRFLKRIIFACRRDKTKPSSRSSTTVSQTGLEL